MSGLMMGTIVWGVLTGILVILMLYRAMLVNHEDDQLFLSQGETAMAKEQQELLARLNKVEPLVKGLAVVSGILLLVLGGVWAYQSLNGPTVY